MLPFRLTSNQSTASPDRGCAAAAAPWSTPASVCPRRRAAAPRRHSPRRPPAADPRRFRPHSSLASPPWPSGSGWNSRRLGSISASPPKTRGIALPVRAPPPRPLGPCGWRAGSPCSRPDLLLLPRPHLRPAPAPGPSVPFPGPSVPSRTGGVRSPVGRSCPGRSGPRAAAVAAPTSAGDPEILIEFPPACEVRHLPRALAALGALLATVPRAAVPRVSALRALPILAVLAVRIALAVRAVLPGALPFPSVSAIKARSSFSRSRATPSASPGRRSDSSRSRRPRRLRRAPRRPRRRARTPACPPVGGLPVGGVEAALGDLLGQPAQLLLHGLCRAAPPWRAPRPWPGRRRPSRRRRR